jgi:hypothetical protein
MINLRGQLRGNLVAVDGPLAFVLMPFDAAYEDVYSDLIDAPLTGAGFVVRRADSLLNQRGILQEVVRGIADAELIIADVTGLNANVLYELGLAHALGKRTVMITQNIDELPFDLRPYKANEYSTRFKEAGKLPELLTKIAASVLANDAEFSNPVQDYAPEALAEKSQVSATPRSRRSPATATDDEEEGEESPGWLEAMVSMETNGSRMGAVSDRIGQLTVDVGNALSKHGARLESAQKNLGDRSPAAALAIARDSAKDLEQFATGLSPLNSELEEIVGSIGEAANILAREQVITDLDALQSAEEQIATLGELESSIGQSYDNVIEFATTLGSLPHVERRLTRAAQSAARAVELTAQVLETAQSEFARARGVLEERAIAARDALDLK